ncbi:MAG: hypothetical protein PF489_02780 [Salinivirgaceae bacterium]|jgi:hypothetical protein|nr:hypothetical protein [Salinivirgaceae bacterium]
MSIFRPLRIVIPLFFALFFANELHAQTTDSFRTDSIGFMEDLHTFMESSKSFEDNGKETVNRLEVLWEAQKLTDTVQKLIYKVANTLRKRQAKAFPHFNGWINTTAAYIEKDRIGTNFFTYQQTVMNLCEQDENRLRHIQTFIETIRELVENNHINKNGSTVWKSDADYHTFRFDADTMRIHFPQSTLTCNAVRDSIQIFATKGFFDPIEKKWYGERGVTFWDRAGYSRDSVFAEFGAYTIDMQLSSVEVDSAQFYNFHFYDKPMVGKLTDRVAEVPTPEKAVFPEFSSYQGAFEIEDIFNGVDFIGGFAIKGARFYGIGSGNENARMEVFRDVEVIKNGDTIIENMLFLKAYSQSIVFTDQMALSRDAKVVLMLNEDSLYHPGLQLTYLKKDKEFTLLRSGSALNMSQSPYYDSYHMIEIDVPLVKWEVGDNKIYFTSLQNSAINNASFMSYNLFNREYFDRFQGFDFRHPFYKIREFLVKNETKEYTAEQIASVLRTSEHEARKMLLHLTYLGFTVYDNNTQKGRMTDKFYDYMLYVGKRKDYDLINIQSTTEGIENAVLNLKNFDFYVNGVPQVHISNAKRVNIYPKQDEIIIKKNRDIDFAGVIETGYYTFFGNNFHFEYDKFGVELKSIDSLHIKVVDFYDNYGKPKFKKVQSTIEDITGNVLIDDPGNKSGIKDNAEYPIFRSTKDSYVYYDAKSIAQGVYTRDTFYFQVDPYEIDSLNSFDAQGMRYTGTFYAGEIFPPIDQELKLQPDNSLGFNHYTPSEGLPVYNGKGHYYDTISMSNQGLKGAGKLEYLAATLWSDELSFYPDTMRTIANRFDHIKQKSPYEAPEIHGEQLNILWRHNMDKLYATTTEKEAQMYSGQGELKGTFYIEPRGINGHGRFSLERGRFRSNQYQFLADELKADVTDFKIQGMDPQTMAFEADSIKTTVNFPTRMARFEALSALKPMFFPINEYKGYINTFEWAIDDNALALKGSSIHDYRDGSHTLRPAPDKMHPRGNLFVSTHPLQHELNFISPKSDINLNNNFIEAHNVKFIEIADATVYPGDGEFTIKPEARYNTLVDAEIEANNISKYHTFYNATVNVNSRIKYSGDGYYDYIDKNKQPQTIRFDFIGVDSTVTTYAKGKVLGDDDFTLSPSFDYRGEVFLRAPDPYLNFKGHFKALANCDLYQQRWVRFENTINPQKVRIPIDSVTVDINDTRLYKGLMLEHDSVHILPRFFTPRNHYTNYYISTANGYLQYNEAGKKYEIAQEARLDNPDTLLDYISVNTESCNLYGEGNISLTGDYGQLKVENFGKANYFHERKEVILDLFSTVDFFFNPECLKYMADTLKNFNGLQPVNMLSERYRRGTKNLIGHKLTDQLLNEQKLFGAFKKFPKELEHTFVLSNINLKWNEKDGTFHSFGDIGITSITDIQVNKYVKGAIQAGTSRTGDYFIMYLELSPSYWFFFKYKRGIMMAVSSDPVYNQFIKDQRAGQRKQKVERGEPKFYYYLASMNDKNRFLQDYRDAELEEEPQNDEKDQNTESEDNQPKKEKKVEDKNSEGTKPEDE